MKQEPAVDYLINEVILDICFTTGVPQEKRYKALDACIRARQLFKEQIEHAATYGANSPSPEEYYNKTYKL